MYMKNNNVTVTTNFTIVAVTLISVTLLLNGIVIDIIFNVLIVVNFVVVLNLPHKNLLVDD
jgi:hypothetical protein